MKKISRAELVGLLPAGTELTYAKGPFNDCERHLTVKRATTQMIVLTSQENRVPFYINIGLGDEYFFANGVFKIVDPDGTELVYLFGHH